MKWMFIPAKMAKQILKEEDLEQVFKDTQGECLVHSGAKLIFRKNRYVLSGYTGDGSDVDQYTSRRWGLSVYTALESMNKKNLHKLVLPDAR